MDDNRKSMIRKCEESKQTESNLVSTNALKTELMTEPEKLPIHDLGIGLD